MPRVLLLLLTLGALLAGCAHRPVSLGCDLPRYKLGVAAPTGGAETATTTPTYETVLRATLAPRRGVTEAAITSPSLLFLSGGSENGAFGAGLLDQWAAQSPGGRLPAFRVVTGVSTGALQAITAFTGRTKATIDGYTIDRENELLQPLGGGLLGAVRKGSVATLGPLRTVTLPRLLDDTLLTDMANAGKPASDGGAGRKLLVGVVNMNSGDAEIIDLTVLAQRWLAASGLSRAKAKSCLIEALVASSSVPLAAPPVFIDDVEYIDGGARFGVFYQASADALQPVGGAESFALPGTAYLIVNGTLAIDPYCPRVPAADGSCPSSGPLRNWDLLSLAQRSVGVLTNQVYRFSADLVRRRADGQLLFQAALIEPAAQAFRFKPDDLPGEATEQSCAAWKADDNRIDRPVQFHRRYMRCLISYGRSRAVALGWGVTR